MQRKSILILTMLFLTIFVAKYSLAMCESDDDCQKVEPGKPRTVKCIEGRCVRSLEITYPKMDNVVIEPYTTDFPLYVKYIFNFGVSIVGIVIFGALLYNGFLYLTSVGDPGKMNEAKSGVISAFFGAIILLSSVLLFNTINPQLTKIKIEPAPAVGGMVEPGIYVCNYRVGNIGDILRRYLTGDEKEQVKAAKELQKIMWNPETRQACPKLKFSGNFRNFHVTADNTIFIIPSIEKNPITKEKLFRWDYGVILHEWEGQKGQADYFPKESNGRIFVSGNTPDIDPMAKHGYSPEGLWFTARSFILFKRLSEEVVGEGVRLYSELNFGRDVSPTPTPLVLDPKGNDIIKVDDLGNFEENTYSISFHPPGAYFALLFNNDGFKDTAILVTKNYPDLIARGLPVCGSGCIPLIGWIFRMFGGECRPCLKSIIVIKGNIL